MRDNHFVHQTQKIYHLEGRLDLNIPYRFRLTTIFLVFTFFAAISATMFVKYSSVKTVRGVLVSSNPIANVVAPRSGVITEVSVHENYIVGKGDELIKVRVQQFSGTGALAGWESDQAFKFQESISEDQVSLERKRALALQEQLNVRLAGLRDEQLVLARQIELQEQLITAAQADYDRLLKYAETGIVSKDQLQKGWQATLDRKSKLLELQQQHAANRSQQRNIVSEGVIADINSHSKVNEFTNTKADLNRLRALAKSDVEYLLKAPISGRISNLRVSEGQYVNEKDNILKIIPSDSSLDAELAVPAHAIGGVKLGQSVVLLYDAFPFERFGSYTGKISYIAKMPLEEHELLAGKNEAASTYLVRIKSVEVPALARQQHAQMQIGGTLTAKIILRKTSIFEILANWKVFEEK